MVVERVEPAAGQFAEGIGGLGVFGEVHAGGFGFVADAEADGLVDGAADDQRAQAGQGDGDQYCDGLGDELLRAAAVEEAAAHAVHREGDEAKGQRADDAGAEVDAHDVQRVIEAELVLQVHEHRAGRTGHEAQAQGRERG